MSRFSDWDLPDEEDISEVSREDWRKFMVGNRKDAKAIRDADADWEKNFRRTRPLKRGLPR